jgi:FemAB-related protein (PEP-CTERM system-associated)
MTAEAPPLSAPPPAPPPRPSVAVAVHTGPAADARADALANLLPAPCGLSRHPGWLGVLRAGLRHDVYLLEATAGGDPVGFLPLVFVRTLLFGRFLVSLPYLNTNGVTARTPDAADALISRAVALADEFRVRYLDLRHEAPVPHPALTATVATKVHMRLPLPGTVEQLWKGLDAKVRNQVRKGEKSELSVEWGGEPLLDPFYAVLAENMRDLGTPVYGQPLFRAALRRFPDDAELCIVRSGEKPVAAAMLLHGQGMTEVPTASSLRAFNPTCANMLMYRHLLDRAVGRGQRAFDFGRSTLDGPTFRFKKQWGAVPHPAAWQYYVREGTVGEMRPDHPKYQRAIRLWQRLPVWATRAAGPRIVRGIP